MPEQLSKYDRLKVLQRLHELQKYAWYCDLPKCNGKPHEGRLYHHCRPAQDLRGHPVIFMRSGRGGGKTRAGAQHIADRMIRNPGHGVGIMADTKAKAQALCIEGPSGLLSAIPPYMEPHFNPHKSILKMNNGSWATIFGANDKDDIERPRGYEFGTIWLEEVGSWRYQMPAWNNMILANRSIKGPDPQTIVTSTPRPVPIIQMLNKWAEDGRAKLIVTSTFDNADNLSPQWLEMMKRQYGDSTLGAQELYGEMVDSVAGALWTKEEVEHSRVIDAPTDFTSIVVAVDPSGGGASECGIVVAGLTAQGRAFILEDASGRMEPANWGHEVVRLYHDWNADKVVGERNFGGDMVENTIRAIDPTVSFELITASRGKKLRADPVKTLFKEQKVWLAGYFGPLETQMFSWVPPGQFETDADGIMVPLDASNYSPDRLDAMVHAVSYLLLRPSIPKSTTYMRYTGR